MKKSTKNRTGQYQKAAVIAVQSILNAREQITDEKLELFEYALEKLPPHRALMVYGHTLLTLSARMDADDPYKEKLRTMGIEITQQMGSSYADLMDSDAQFYEDQRIMLSSKMSEIGDVLETLIGDSEHLQEKAA